MMEFISQKWSKVIKVSGWTPMKMQEWRYRSLNGKKDNKSCANSTLKKQKDTIKINYRMIYSFRMNL